MQRRIKSHALYYFANYNNVAGTTGYEILVHKHSAYNCDFVYFIEKRKRWKTSKYNNVNFDIMEGHEFEYFCSELLKDNGCNEVSVTRGSGDHGIDVLASKNGMKYAIQCKCYSKNVGNKAVQEAFSGKEIYRANVAVVMTNRYFTKQAQEDARKLGVELWDRDKIIYLMKNAVKNISKK